MSKLVFDQESQKYFSAGVSQCVLSVKTVASQGNPSVYGTPVAWDGIVSIAHSPEGGEPTELYADNIKYLELTSAEELGGTIEAYQAPAEFDVCDGYANPGSNIGLRVGQQSRRMFGLAYITQKGNDIVGSDYSEVLHIVYGCKATPSEASYESINDSPDAITFSWTYSCTPITDTTVALKPIYSIEIDKDVYSAARSPQTNHWDKLINYIYGVDADPTADPPILAADPHFPLPSEVAKLLSTGSAT